MMPEMMMAANAQEVEHRRPHTSTSSDTWPASAPNTSAMMGSLAPQGIIVVVMMVMRRSRSFSMVLVAMTAGTPQPRSDEHGDERLLPDRPKLPEDAGP